MTLNNNQCYADGAKSTQPFSSVAAKHRL